MHYDVSIKKKLQHRRKADKTFSYVFEQGKYGPCDSILPRNPGDHTGDSSV